MGYPNIPVDRNHRWMRPFILWDEVLFLQFQFPLVALVFRVVAHGWKKSYVAEKESIFIGC